MTVGLIAGSCALVIGVLLSGSDPFPFQRGLPTVSVTTGEYVLLAEVASTPDQWRRGLSFRRTVAENHAMLFVFDQNQKLGFSVRDTFVPLSVAFISEAGIIEEIQPLTRKKSPYIVSSHTVRFAIETNAGWFSQRGIIPGQQVLAAGYIPIEP